MPVKFEMVQAEKDSPRLTRAVDQGELSRDTNRGPARQRIAHLLDRLIFCSLLVVIALTAIPYGTVEPWWEALFECLMLALTSLWIIEGALSGSWRVSGKGLLAPLAALIIFAFLQTLPLLGPISVSAYDTRLFAFKLIGVTLAGALLLRYTSSRSRLRALIYLVIGVGVASALFGIIRQTTQRDANGFFLPFLERGYGYGQFINRNHFAFLMEMALGLALGMVVGGGERRDRLLIYLAAALPVWTALVLSNSRGGIFSMLSQLLFLALMFSIMRPTREMLERDEAGALTRLKRLANSWAVRGALMACLVLAMIVGVLWMGGDPLAQRLESLQSDASSTIGDDGRESAQRTKIWAASLRLTKEHGIAGVGFGAYWVAVSRYYDSSGRSRPYEAHNDYLEVLASGGLIGAALVAWFIVVFIRQARRSLRSNDSLRRTATLGALAGLFGIAVHSLVDFGLQITVNAVICATLIVIATADERVEEKTLPSISVLKRRPRPENSATSV